MKRSKLYVVVAILTTIFLFSFAALCNQCEVKPEEEKEGIEEAEAEEEEEEETDIGSEEEETEEAAEEETATEETEGEEEEEEGGEKTAPTIELEIYEGPTYSADDDVCYYRIKATVTGNPAPAIEFSKDDSLGSFGSKKAQVNLNDPSETYTLTATATNSEGTVTDSIDISWGCEEEATEEDEEEEEGEEEVIPISEAILNVVGDETGTIQEGDPGQVTNSFVYAGDWINDMPCSGYISFDINSLHGKNIQSVRLTLSSPTIYGTHAERQFLGWLHIGIVDYGITALSLADRSASATSLVRYNTLKTDINYSGDNLKNALQSNIDGGRPRIQFKLYWTYEWGTTDSDGERDGNDFTPGNIHLRVEYTD